MIDINLLRNAETKEATVSALQKRGVALEAIHELLKSDEEWLKLSKELEQKRNEKKEGSTAVAGSPADMRPLLIKKMQSVSEEEKAIGEKTESLSNERDTKWRQIPNIPLSDVQAGGENDAVEIAKSDAQVPNASGTPKNYLDLMGSRVDMERGAKVSGARFTYLSGDLARLELGIASYIMDKLAQEKFVQIIPPVLLGKQAMAGMGYLDQAGDEVYQTQDDLYLVGTSEQSLGAMHMDEIVPAEKLPIRYMAFTPCFRREAGSHGKDVKGILRLHQFDKVEMFSITTPDKSEEEHQFLLQMQRNIMDDFKLPYRVIRLAAGDLGAPSAKTYDIETWIPSEQRYRETHSTSNTTDYQSRRLNIRFKDKNSETQKVHMVNGTAAAMSRLLIALIENHQQTDGSVTLPSCLHQYLPFQKLSPTVE